MIDLFDHLRPFLTAMTLCTPRLLTAFLIAPFFNTDMITGVTRNCIVLSFSLIVFPTILPFIESHTLTLGFVFSTVVKEAVIGALFGYIAGLFFYAIASVGHIIDHQRGASMASVMDPASGEQISPMGSLFMQAVIILFFTTNGFILFLSSMYESYSVWPIQSFWPRFDSGIAQFFLGKVDEMMAMTFVLASPVVIALFISEFGLGLIGRFAPQLNVFFLSMPIKSGVAVLVLIFYLKFALGLLKNDIIRHVNIFDVLRQVVH